MIATNETIYQIKITLEGTDPPIWRRILVKDFPLANLHEIIQVAMGWENCHLHAFRVGKRTFSIPMEELGTEDEDADAVTLESLGLNKVGSKFIYEYDFGDGWEHEILVEGSKNRVKNRIYPRCLKAVRACPPEDCGGIYGYTRLLRILKTPKHSEYEDVVDWIGDEFDPKFVDVEAINKHLAEGFTT